MSTPESIYYQDSNITITNAHAILGSKTYAMANITSVSMGTVAANRTAGISISLFGFIVFLCSLMGRNVFLVGVLGAVIFIGLGIYLAYSAKPQYTVIIGSSSGESNALSAHDSEYIQRIVNSINEAIVKRG